MAKVYARPLIRQCRNNGDGLSCVYRKLDPDVPDDEVRREWDVTAGCQCAELGDARARLCSETGASERHYQNTRRDPIQADEDHTIEVAEDRALR